MKKTVVLLILVALSLACALIEGLFSNVATWFVQLNGVLDISAAMAAVIIAFLSVRPENRDSA